MATSDRAEKSYFSRGSLDDLDIPYNLPAIPESMSVLYFNDQVDQKIRQSVSPIHHRRSKSHPPINLDGKRGKSGMQEEKSTDER
jgi:hypothetical protein